LIKTPVAFGYLIARKETFASTAGGTGSLAVILPGLVVFAGTVWLALTSRDQVARWGPWAILGLVYGIPLVPFALGPRFLLPAIAVLLVVVAYAVDIAPQPWRTLVAGALVGLVGVGFLAEVRANNVATTRDREWRSDLAFLKERLGGAPSILDGGHVYRYYLPDHDIDDLFLNFDRSELMVRRAGEYHDLSDGDLAGKYIGILRRRTEFPGTEADSRLGHQCPLTARPTLWLWDCTAIPPS
jgi:hypothetical protein